METIQHTVHINDQVEFVEYSDGSIGLYRTSDGIKLNNDDAYKIFACLQSLFADTPIVDHSGNSI